MDKLITALLACVEESGYRVQVTRSWRTESREFKWAVKADARSGVSKDLMLVWLRCGLVQPCVVEEARQEWTSQVSVMRDSLAVVLAELQWLVGEAVQNPGIWVETVISVN